MQVLSKEAEDRVIEAIKRAVDLVDRDGLSPTAAMTKVAMEQRWNPNMIKFASHAYNTGRQTAQRETSENVLDKFAAFPLVDPAKVIESVWPTNVKSAALTKLATDVSDDYTRPPTFIQHRDHARRVSDVLCSGDAAIKAAEDKKGFDAIQQAAISVTEVFNTKEKLSKQAEEARHQASVAYDRMLNGLDKLATYFKQLPRDRKSFAEVKIAAEAYHGNAAAALLEWVYGRNRLKEAKDGVKFAHVVAYDTAIEPYNLIQSCIDLGRNVAEKRAAEQQTKAKLDEHVNTKQASFNAKPEIPKVWTLVGERDMTEKEAAGMTASVMGSAAGSSFGTGLRDVLNKAFSGGGGGTDRVQDAVNDLEDPAHDAKLRQIRTQAMLADMMNDKVIGSYDPDHVANAFNEISQLAPRAAQQPFAIRSLLRRSLQGHVEPFEAKEVTDIEKSLKDTESNPSSSYPSTKIIGNGNPKSII